MNELTTIQLSQDDVKAFLAFQKHYTLIGLLESLGAFDVKSGSVEIHFNAIGQIGSVDIHRHFKGSRV